MRIKTYLDNALYLSSLFSDLRMFKVNDQIINDKLYRCDGFFKENILNFPLIFN